MEGYEHIYKIRKNRPGGGVSIYIKNSIKYDIRENLFIDVDGVDSISVEIPKEEFKTQKNIIVTSVYRPPNTNPKHFVSKVNTFLHQLHHENKHAFILGDYNINMNRLQCIYNTYTISIQYDDTRIIGIEVQSNDFTLLFLTVYLPYECDMYYDDYCFYLSKLQCIIDSANTPYIFILGDFNADIQSTSMFGAELIDFCDNNNLCFIDKEKLLPDSFTFVSQAHGTTSWLDHCITTASGKSITSNVSIIDDIVCSDHYPICIEIVCDINV